MLQSFPSELVLFFDHCHPLSFYGVLSELIAGARETTFLRKSLQVLRITKSKYPVPHKNIELSWIKLQFIIKDGSGESLKMSTLRHPEPKPGLSNMDADCLTHGYELKRAVAETGFVSEAHRAMGYTSGTNP